MPKGKRRMNEPPRQMAWMMIKTWTEDASGLTFMSAVPEMAGMSVELAAVLVMSTKNTPEHVLLVGLDSLRYRV